MTRRAAPIVAFAVLALALAPALPARADSALLEWQYECLKQPDAICYDATPSGSDPLPKPPAATVSAGDGKPAASPPTANDTPPVETTAKVKVAAPVAHADETADPLHAIAARLQARHPTPADLATLQARATAGNARALELLAWAELVGAGVARDPVQAYFLYGIAAAAGAPNGRRDQALIYENSLTAEQRQEILLVENGNLKHDQR